MTEEVQIPDRVRKVYGWCSQLTSESRKEITSYVWPEEIRNLLIRLKLSKGALIALQGYSGTGKSSALRAINNSIRECVSFKLVHRDILTSYSETYHDHYYDAYSRWLKDTVTDPHVIPQIKSKYDKLIGKVGDKDQLGSELLEYILPKSKIKQVKKDVALACLQTHKIIMIDLQDYSVTDRRAMTGDLNVIQELWNHLINNGWEGNLVVSVQKELVEGEHGITHYLLRKMDIVELKPFKPGRLVEAYTQAFKEVYPFQEQALMRVARLSRGIWRRYLRYLRLCLDAWIAKGMNGEIDTAFTSEAVSNMEVGRDIEDELTAMFPKSDDMRRKALKTIHYLISLKKGILQKALAKGLNLSETETSRLFEKMDAIGLTYRQQTEEGKMVFSNI